jgi:hypothetical protein
LLWKFNKKFTFYLLCVVPPPSPNCGSEVSNMKETKGGGGRWCRACNEILLQVTFLLYLYIIYWKAVMTVFNERGIDGRSKNSATDHDVMFDV